MGSIEIEKTSLASAMKTLGNVKIQKSGDAADARRSICYELRSKPSYFIIAASTEISGPDVGELVFTSTPDKRKDCSAAKRISQVPKLNSGLELYMTPDAAVKLLGEPSEKSPTNIKWFCSAKEGSSTEFESTLTISVDLKDDRIIQIRINKVTTG